MSHLIVQNLQSKMMLTCWTKLEQLFWELLERIYTPLHQVSIEDSAMSWKILYGLSNLYARQKSLIGGVQIVGNITQSNNGRTRLTEKTKRK